MGRSPVELPPENSIYSLPVSRQGCDTGIGIVLIIILGGLLIVLTRRPGRKPKLLSDRDWVTNNAQGGVELMPEPEDGAILTAVDRGAEGYSGKDYGLSDKEAGNEEAITRWSFVWPYGAVGGAASIVVMGYYGR